jgi:hypothetical protein
MLSDAAIPPKEDGCHGNLDRSQPGRPPEEPAAPGPGLGASIHARFAALGGVDLPIEPREPVRLPPELAAPVAVAQPSRRLRPGRGD